MRASTYLLRYLDKFSNADNGHCPTTLIYECTCLALTYSSGMCSQQLDVYLFSFGETQIINGKKYFIFVRLTVMKFDKRGRQTEKIHRITTV